MSRTLKSYQVIQHTQLNLLQSPNAISLQITAWCTRGCPQLAASCDTLTPYCIVIVFQLQLLSKPFRQRWLVSPLFISSFFALFPLLLIGRGCQRIVHHVQDKRAITCNDYCYVLVDAWQFCADEIAEGFHIILTQPNTLPWQLETWWELDGWSPRQRI